MSMTEFANEAPGKENDRQITTGKTRLRGRIKELEQELSNVRSQPLRTKLAKLEQDHAALRARCEAIEATAAEAIELALKLARLITGE